MRVASLLPSSLSASLLLASVLGMALVGCGEPRQVGDVAVQGDTTTYNYYGELREKPEAGRERIYLFCDPQTVAGFGTGTREMPQSKTMIGAGPNKETMILEQVKDPAQSAIIAKRLIATFNQRNNAAVQLR